MRQGNTLPPFRIDEYVAVAYVSGRYTPSGPRPGPHGFLGLYLSQTEHRFDYFICKTDGSFLAQLPISQKDANLEFALIRGAIDYAVPFEQWRLFPIGKAERRILSRLGLKDEYEKVRHAVAQVLYHARLIWYFSIDKMPAKLGISPKRTLNRWFAVRRRSTTAIRRDTAERDEIFQLVFNKRE